MRLDWARLTIRLGRFELLAFGGLVMAVTVGAFLAAAWVDSLTPLPECLTFDEFGNSPPGCQLALDQWYSAKGGLGGLLGGLVIALPLVAGLFLGVPIVARELERGTTRLAWSLAPSRLRWYLARLVPALLVVAAISFAAGVGADRMMAASEPGIDLANSFMAFGYHGILLASRAVFIFAIAVAVGALVARSLPSIIIAGLVAGIGLIGGSEVHDRILRAEAVPVDQAQILPGDRCCHQRFRLPDGTLVGWEYFANEPNGPYDDQGISRYPEVIMVVPGTRYGEVEAREALALGGASLVALVLAGLVVQRRRPD